MKTQRRNHRRGLFALVLLLAMASGCATEKKVGNDPSQWVHPDAELVQPASSARISVSRLLDYLDKGWGSTPPPTGWSDETVHQRARLEAAMYIAGVLDGGNDGRWCIARSGLPPHEVDAALVKRLRQVAPDTNAALALQQAAASQFPCNTH